MPAKKASLQTYIMQYIYECALKKAAEETIGIWTFLKQYKANQQNNNNNNIYYSIYSVEEEWKCIQHTYERKENICLMLVVFSWSIFVCKHVESSYVSASDKNKFLKSPYPLCSLYIFFLFFFLCILTPYFTFF